MQISGRDDRNLESKVPVTVIVLVHNTPDLLLQCLLSFCESCLAQSWQIVVVDNGSEEEARLIVDEKFSGVVTIRSERNLGFAAGNNLGLREAKGSIVILINSDVIASPETLGDLVAALQKEPRAGAMSPSLLTARGEPQAFAYGDDVSPAYLIRRGLRSLLGLGPLHDWATGEARDVGWVSAACLCVRAEVIRQVGCLDERFPLYFEDADWCMRIRAAGWKVIYNPQLHVMHLGGASRPGGPAGRKELYDQSLLLFCEKHYGRGWKLLLRLFLAAYRLLDSARSAFLGRPAENR